MRSQAGPIASTTSLTRNDADAIRKEARPYLEAVAPLQITQRVVSSPTASWPTSVVGSTPDLQINRDWKMTHGCFYDDDDLKKLAPVCLIGETVRRKLFPNNPNPVGEWLRIDNLRVKIIGVPEAKGRSPTGIDQDDQVLMPLTTLQQKLAGEENVNMILATARSEEMIDQAKQEITRVMRAQHHVKKGAEDFDVSSVQEMAEIAVVLTQTMQFLIVIIVSISLVVGGIGIMNIMLVSVAERTREIGIRMAVGATPDDVRTQFLMEAMTLSLLGGVIGILLGMFGAMTLAWLASWPLIVSPFTVLLAFFISAAVGIFFGFYPAWKALRLVPIDALRYE